MTPSIDALPDLISQGMRAKQVARIVGLSVHRVYKKAWELDLCFRYDGRKRVLLALADGPLTVSDIAKKTGMLPTSVRYFCKLLVSAHRLQVFDTVPAPPNGRCAVRFARIGWRPT